MEKQADRSRWQPSPGAVSVFGDVERGTEADDLQCRWSVASHIFRRSDGSLAKASAGAVDNGQGRTRRWGDRETRGMSGPTAQSGHFPMDESRSTEVDAKAGGWDQLLSERCVKRNSG
jgi:hypothetical protein